MKFLIFFTTLSFLVNLNSIACLPNGITFTTQQEIDDFPTNYTGCDIIEGDLKIEGNDITNLNGLSSIEEIEGFFQIDNCENLSSLTGLDNVLKIGAALIVNSGLTDFQGLNNLSSVSFSFSLTNNLDLESFNGLGSLQEVGTAFQVNGTPKIKNFLGLNELSQVNQLSVNNNDSIVNFEGLESLTFFNQATINDNPKLENFVGLEGLENIGSPNNIAFFMLTNNDTFVDFTGLENVENIIANITLDSLNSFEGFNGLENLQLMYSLYMNKCPVFNDFSNLNNIEMLENLEIYYSDAMEGLNGLENLKYIYNSLTLIENGSLTDIDALQNLETVEFATIGSNENLESLNLNSLKETQSSFFIYGNNSLSEVTGLNNLEKVGGSFVISNNENLASLNGLENLKEINTSLELRNLTLISTLVPLSNLEIIGSLALIEELNNLSSLEGLENVDGSQLNNLVLINNSKLSVCAITSVCKFFEVKGPNAGMIENNNNNCSSQSEIIDECEVLTLSENSLELNIYPNPASEKLYIDFEGLPAKNTKLSLYTLKGEHVLSRNIDKNHLEIDLLHLESGIYSLKIRGLNGVSVHKVSIIN